MWSRVLLVLVLGAVIQLSSAFSPSGARTSTRMAPLHESFGLSAKTILQQKDAAPAVLLGEANYRNFVSTYDKGALILKTGEPFASGVDSGPSTYDLIGRVRDQKLLTQLADSGLLEALEAKGATLTQLENLLPLVDNLGLLRLALNNKDLVVGALPLVVESAPQVLPLVVSLLRTPPATFQLAGIALAGAGVFEVTQDHALLGAPLALLGAPLLVLGTVLNSVGSIAGSLPPPSSYSARASAAPRSKGPKTAAPRVVKSASSGGQNGRRKTVRINKR